MRQLAVKFRLGQLPANYRRSPGARLSITPNVIQQSLGETSILYVRASSTKRQRIE